jgi:hypothetical protein
VAVEPEHETGVVRDADAAKEQRIAKTDNPGTGVYGANPNLAGRIVVGVFADRAAAEAGARSLRSAGVREASITVSEAQPGQAPEISAGATKAGSGGRLGLLVGAGIGAALAVLATILVPNITLLLPGGLLTAAILGAIFGAALGGLVGGMRGLGVPKREAVRYAAAVRSGGPLVTVRTQDAETAELAEAVLRRAGASEVQSYQDML